MAEDDFLAMSGIQHFAFCRRQWALIHLEQQWAENLRTAEGRLEHDHCHDDTFAEKRGDLLVVRGMRVNSGRLRKVAKRASTTVSGCRTRCLSACWMPHSTRCSRRS